jgi:GNAT superfamily N-acetyltransferase
VSAIAVEITRLDERTVAALVAAFCVPGWNKPPDQYPRYLDEQDRGVIVCFVASVGGELAGYLKVVWEPGYPPYRDEGIPEIQDLNVLDRFRRRGVASRLLDRAEAEVATRSPIVGIGVGLHSGYNAAQRLYVLRGYVPDGLGVTYQNRPVRDREVVTFDDELVLHFTKTLSAGV